jgi:HlyD family secretion protein
MNGTTMLSIILAVALFGCSAGDGNSITESGTLEATEVTVSAQVGGPIVRVNVEEGALARPGDTLLVIDVSDYVLQLRQAEAGLAMADAQYRLAVEGTRREDLLQAEANFKSAEEDLRRMEELRASNSVSQKQLDDALTRFTVAQQAYEKAKRGSREAEIVLARARRDQAAAHVASLEKKVSDCHVLAPAAGTVTKRFVERGELAGPGMALLRLADLSVMNVTVYVPESYLPKVQLGSKATVGVDAFAGRAFEGRVVYISPVAEFTPKNIQTREERTKLVFAVKLRVENAGGALKAGIPADVTFSLSH